MIQNGSKNTREWKTTLIQPIYKGKRNQRTLENTEELHYHAFYGKYIPE